VRLRQAGVCVCMCVCVCFMIKQVLRIRGGGGGGGQGSSTDRGAARGGEVEGGRQGLPLLTPTRVGTPHGRRAAVPSDTSAEPRAYPVPGCPCTSVTRSDLTPASSHAPSLSQAAPAPAWRAQIWHQRLATHLPRPRLPLHQRDALRSDTSV